jgi:hypothetical protein
MSDRTRLSILIVLTVVLSLALFASTIHTLSVKDNYNELAIINAVSLSDLNNCLAERASKVDEYTATLQKIVDQGNELDMIQIFIKTPDDAQDTHKLPVYNGG